MLTIKGVADHLRQAAKRFRPALEEEAIALAEQVAMEAKAMIGREHDAWPPLALSTIAEKQRLGFETPAPLKRTGELQDSIKGEVEPTLTGAQIIVGSTDPKAVFHELGAARLPPRPFLGPALIKSEPAIGKALGELVLRALEPGVKL